MFFQISIAILIGICAGTLTGLSPGIHINLLAVVLISAFAYITKIITIQPEIIIITIFAMSITHTFLDVIPSIFLGAPDEAHALNALPGHRLLIKGEGYHAVLYSLLGSFISLIITIIALPAIFILIILIYDYLLKIIPYFIIATLLFMFWKGKNNIIKNITVYTLASIVGVLTLKQPLNYFLNQPFYHLFTGFFGIAVLLLSENNLPEQKSKKKPIEIKPKKSIFSLLGGMMTGILPGISSAVGISLLEPIIKEMDEKDFIYFSSGINTVAMIVSLYTFYLIGRMRNGIMVSINSISAIDFIILIKLLIIAIITGSIALILGMIIAKQFSKIISTKYFNYKIIRISIIIALIILSFFFDRFLGIIIILTATAIGILAQKWNAKRAMLMGVLITPLLMFYFL